MTLAYLVACAALAYSGFCRLVRTDHDTRFIARLAFWSLTTASIAGIAAVLFWGYAPEWPAVGMAIGMASVQIVASELWRSGVPMQYIQPDKRHGYRMQRRSDDAWPGGNSDPAFSRSTSDPRGRI
jgi:hypothetical protein